MSLQFVLSNKGHPLLKHEGYLFRKYQKSTVRTYWRCTQFDSSKCRGTAITSDGNVIKHSDHHNHVPDVAAVEAKEVMAKIKEIATNCQESTNNVLAIGTANVASSVSGKLPTVSLIKRTIQRKRQRYNHAPANPATLSHLIIAEEYSLTEINEQFLLYDSGSKDPQRFIIFATQNSLRRLSNSNHWFADGTFKTCPQLFAQLYTIHSIQYNDVLPSVFVLMSDMSQNGYSRVFEELKCHQDNLRPQSILTDFELSAVNAFQMSFPNSEHRGCFFIFLKTFGDESMNFLKFVSVILVKQNSPIT